MPIAVAREAKLATKENTAANRPAKAPIWFMAEFDRPNAEPAVFATPSTLLTTLLTLTPTL